MNRAPDSIGSPRLASLGLTLLPFLLPCASAAGAQDVRERPPNLSGGWVGQPGAAHFNFLHRFQIASGTVANSPTMLIALPLFGRTLAGMNYSTSSGVAGESNEWETFLRWAPLSPARFRVEAALTGAYNSASESLDAELSLALPTGRARILGAGRFFSDADGGRERGWALAGGATLELTDHVSLAGDYGAAWIDGGWGQPAWGAGIHLQIPTTPHSLSLQATSTRTGSLQGSSLPGLRSETLWGFEFTIPITFARYRSRPPARAEVVPVDAGVREVSMTDDLRFAPEVLEIRVGETVTFRNTTRIPHTVTAHPDRVRNPELVVLPEGAEPFDSGIMLAGDVFRHTFTVPGEYVYVCAPHEAMPMLGTIRVLP